MESSTRFSLESALCKWRESQRQSGALTSDDLEELEYHLRDSVTELQNKGLTAEEAFLIATKRVGSETDLQAEFRKVNSKSLWAQQIIWMMGGWFLISSVYALSSSLGNFLAILTLKSHSSWIYPKVAAAYVFGFCLAIIITILFVRNFAWSNAKRLVTRHSWILFLALPLIILAVQSIGTLSMAFGFSRNSPLSLQERQWIASGSTVAHFLISGLILPTAFALLMFRFLRRQNDRPVLQ